MLEDLKYYLMVMGVRLENRRDSELLLSEVSAIAVKNWVDREGDPILTKQQFLKALRRVIIKKESTGLN